MLRGSLCIALVLVSMLAGAPTSVPSNAHSSHIRSAAPGLIPYLHDPNGTRSAFNSTLANFDLYTNRTASVSPITPAANITWVSRLNSTQTGLPIKGTGFIYKGPSSTFRQTINWTLNIPKGAGTTTFLKFDWNGTLGSGTSVRYLLYNGTSLASPLVLKVAQNANFPGGPPLNSTGVVPLNCGAKDECFDVSKFIGFNMTLTFLFNSTSTGAGLKVQVSNIEVGSVGAFVNNAYSHYMFQNPSNSTEIVHYGNVALVYNNTVTYPKPNVSGQNLNHTWSNMLVNLYTPASYRVDSITLNGTTIFPATYPFLRGACIPKSLLQCTNTVLVSLNMTAPNAQVKNKVALFIARSINAVKSLGINNQGMATDSWVPGEDVTASVNNQPGVNVTGGQNVWLKDPNGIFPINNFTSSSGVKSGTTNYTVSLPLSPLGAWTVTATFINGYDYGILSHKFRVEELTLNSGSFAYGGGAGNGTALTVQGVLSYASNSSAAANVNATVFAVDLGSRGGTIQSMGTPSSGLYISSITLVGGAFGTGDSMTMYFSLVNPTQQQFSGNVTIEHEWSTGQLHVVNATFPLKFFGDEPFLSPTPFVYRVIATITSSGTQLQVQSLQTNNKMTVNMSPGVGGSPVPSLREHFGLFKMTIRSKNLASSSISSQSVESPTYAYVLYAPLIPSRYLAFSKTVTTRSDGSFSTSVTSDQLLAAKNLVLVVLARDANGIVLGDRSRNPTGASDSTILTPTADVPSEVGVKQSVSVTLHLKSNSTKIPITLTVNLDVTGGPSIPTVRQTVTVAPGTTKDIPLSFTAPSTAGTYIFTFSSNQYGAPFLTKTVQVSLVPSSLQTLLPLAIGLGFALIVLAVYMLKRQPTEPEPKEKEKQKPSPGKPSKPQTDQPSSKSLTRT